MLLAAEAFDGAFDSFRRAVEGDPRDASALDGLADAARGATRVREGITLLQSIRQHDAANLIARVHLSHLLAAQGSWDAAIDVAREALALDPADATAREQLASIYADQEDAAHLAPLAAEMMRDTPDGASSYYYEGTTQFLAGNIAGAARLADRATRIDRKHSGAWILAGAAYANLGDTARARRSFESAIDADPRNPAAYLNLGMLEAASGDLDRAAATLAEALIVEPAYQPARGALADVLERTGEKTRAAALRRR
jgi:Flp pilus assembly protein TadD